MTIATVQTTLGADQNARTHKAMSRLKHGWADVVGGTAGATAHDMTPTTEPQLQTRRWAPALGPQLIFWR